MLADRKKGKIYQNIGRKVFRDEKREELGRESVTHVPNLYKKLTAETD